MMKAKQVEQLITKISSLSEKQNKWIEILPPEISSAFFDNPYTGAYSEQVSQLLKFIFGDWYEDVSYFLDESSPHRITTPKGDYVINNVKEYIDYLVNEGFLEDDRI